MEVIFIRHYILTLLESIIIGGDFLYISIEIWQL